MIKEDYLEIKDKFGQFILTWKTRDIQQLDQFVDPEAECYLSTVKAYATGTQHGLFGVRDFIKDIPLTDVMHLRITNFVCHGTEQEAQQLACVIGRAHNSDLDAVHTFEFTANFAIHWEKSGQGWLMTVIRMDMIKHRGEIPSFEEQWHFEDPKGAWYNGIHLPVINGELDSPWNRYPDDKHVFFEAEDAIQECFSKYMYGVDTISYRHCVDTVSEDAVFVTSPWGVLNKRERLLTSKFHRQKDRNGTHPFRVKSIDVQDDMAICEFYRMSGHRQREHEYVFTQDTVDREYACAKWKLQFRREDGIWRIYKFEYMLGIIELGCYGDELYDR